MRGRIAEAPVSEAERIARVYVLAARGDTWAALVQAVADALIDLAEVEQRATQRDQLISRGYARAGQPSPSAPL